MSAHECTRCSSTLENAHYQYLSVPGTESSNKYCAECAVLLWHCPIQFVFHVGIPDDVRATLQSYEMLAWCKRWFGNLKTMTVEVYHRREAETVGFMMKYPSAHRHTGVPTEPYSYRGWCSSLEIILLWDETETLDSIKWICLHELGHHACNNAQMFDMAMQEENKTEGRTTYEWKDDAGHEADSEERLVNRIATAYMGGREYARPWWRPRVQAKIAGLPMPDPYEVLSDVSVTPSVQEPESAVFGGTRGQWRETP